MENKKGEIVIYETPDGHTSIEVSLEKGAVWLTQQQIADLFGTQRPAITKHLGNIFRSKELDENSVCSILEHTADDGKKYQTRFYHLDAVLSVGYRVNSKSATHFRIWANSILKDYLVKGYAHNEKLLREKQAQLESLKKAVALITNVTGSQALSGDQATGLLSVLTDFTYALDVLDKYDHQVLEIEATSPKQLFHITYDSAMGAIHSLRDKFGGSTLFGNEKDESFQGSRKLADNALVALTLMIAESKPEEKDVMAKVVVSLINGYN